MDFNDYVLDPVAPKISTIFPNASMINVTKIPQSSAPLPKTKPFVQYLYQTKSQITCIKCFPHSDKFAISSSNSMYVMTNDSDPCTIFFKDLPTHFIRTIDIHPTEQIAALNSDGSSIRIVNTITGSSILYCNAHSLPVTSVFFAPSMKKVVSSSLDGTIVIYDLLEQKVSYVFDLLKGQKAISTAAIKNDESFIACGFSDGTLGLFDDRIENGLVQIDAHKSWINNISFHPLLNTIATGSADQSLSVWDIRNPGHLFSTFKDNESPIIKTELCDNEVWGMTRDGVFRIWDTNNSKLKHSYKTSALGLMSCDIKSSKRLVYFAEKNMTLGVMSI